MSEDCITTNLPTINYPKYECPIHGVTENVITSTIPGHEGYWCQTCWIDTMDRLGVARVTPFDKTKKPPTP